MPIRSKTRAFTMDLSSICFHVQLLISYFIINMFHLKPYSFVLMYSQNVTIKAFSFHKTRQKWQNMYTMIYMQ